MNKCYYQNNTTGNTGWGTSSDIEKMKQQLYEIYTFPLFFKQKVDGAVSFHYTQSDVSSAPVHGVYLPDWLNLEGLDLEKSALLRVAKFYFINGSGFSAPDCTTPENYLYLPLWKVERVEFLQGDYEQKLGSYPKIPIIVRAKNKDELGKVLYSGYSVKPYQIENISRILAFTVEYGHALETYEPQHFVSFHGAELFVKNLGKDCWARIYTNSTFLVGKEPMVTLL